MSRVTKREPQKKSSLVISRGSGNIKNSCISSITAKSNCTTTNTNTNNNNNINNATKSHIRSLTARPQQPTSQNKKNITLNRRLSKTSSNSSKSNRNNEIPILSIREPFPPLLRMPPLKEMYTGPQINNIIKNMDNYHILGNRLSSSSSTSDDIAIAGIFLKQLRAALALYIGKVMNTSNGVESSNSNIVSGACSSNTGVNNNNNNNNVGNSLENSSQKAGLTLYRYLYDLHQWLFPRGINYNGRSKIAKNAWQALFSKRNHPWRTLLNALDSELILVDENVAAGVLTILYNILRTTRRLRRKKAVKNCFRLRLPQICASILEEYEAAFKSSVGVYDINNFNNNNNNNNINIENSNHKKEESSIKNVDIISRVSQNGMNSNSFSLIRIVEATGMILAICGIEIKKFLVAVRRSKSLKILLQASEIVLTNLERNLASLGIQDKSYSNYIFENDTISVNSNNEYRVRFNISIQNIISISNSLLHFIASLHQLALHPSNAEFIGSRGVKLCIQVGWVINNFLSNVTKIKSSLSSSSSSSSLLQQKQQQHLGFIWSLILILQSTAYWSIEFLRRLCSIKHKSSKLTLETARHHHAIELLFEFSKHSLARGEVVLAALNTLNALTVKDSGCREQLYVEMGGLSNLVRGVISAAETAGRSSLHWHKLYLSLYALFGIVTLPGENSFIIKGHENNNNLSGVRVVPIQNSLSNLQQNIYSNLTLTSLESELTPEISSDISLLPIDTHPEAFSPELRISHTTTTTTNNNNNNNNNNSVDIFPFITPEKLPWVFSDNGPPISQEIMTSLFPADEIDVIEARNVFPLQSCEILKPPSEETRVKVLKHLIERLCTSLHSINRIIYERSPLMFTPVDSTIIESEKNEIHSLLNKNEVHCRSTQLPETSSPLQGFLKFYSDFESGNLQRAIAIEVDEYDLILSSDTNTNCHVQWFCFAVEDYIPGASCRFNILNMEKSNSTFNEGQRPLMLFVEDTSSTNNKNDIPQWTRCGYDIFYYQNLYRRPARFTTTTTTTTISNNNNNARKNKNESTVNNGKQNLKKKNNKKSLNKKNSLLNKKDKEEEETLFCYTLSFTVKFPLKSGRIYFANCFPYTYSNLLKDIQKWQVHSNSSIMVAVQHLCYTPGKLSVPIITVTATNSFIEEVDNNDNENNDIESDSLVPRTLMIEERPVCIVTSRVHPGESNSSWMLRGLMSFLLRDDEQSNYLRKRFVWKIIPMLNPDGVVVGNHRSSLFGADLNRDYADPKPFVNPVIYSLKRLTKYIIEYEKRHVALFADFHGHSRAKNFLIYGCTPRIEVQENKTSNKTTKKNSTLNTNSARSSSTVATSNNNNNNNRRSIPTTTVSFNTASSPLEKLIPLLLSGLSPTFSMPQCSFTVQKSKKNTGRVVMYRHFGIRMSYTLEATMMGGKGDELSNYNIDILQKKILGEIIKKKRQIEINTEVIKKVDNEKELENEEEEYGVEETVVEGREEEETVELWPHEVSYNTRNYENMGATLARSLNLLASHDASLDTAEKEAMERAWSLLLLPTHSNNNNHNNNNHGEAASGPTSPLMGGSYAFATRRGRRSEVNKNKNKREKAAVASQLSWEQREAVRRALLVRPRRHEVLIGGGSGSGSGGALLGVETDDDEDDEEEEGEEESDEDEDRKGNRPRRGSGVDNDDNEEDDEDDDDDGEDEEDDDNDEDDEEEEDDDGLEEEDDNLFYSDDETRY